MFYFLENEVFYTKEQSKGKNIPLLPYIVIYLFSLLLE